MSVETLCISTMVWKTTDNVFSPLLVNSSNISKMSDTLLIVTFLQSKTKTQSMSSIFCFMKDYEWLSKSGLIMKTKIESNSSLYVIITMIITITIIIIIITWLMSVCCAHHVAPPQTLS